MRHTTTHLKMKHVKNFIIKHYCCFFLKIMSILSSTSLLSVLLNVLILETSADVFVLNKFIHLACHFQAAHAIVLYFYNSDMLMCHKNKNPLSPSISIVLSAENFSYTFTSSVTNQKEEFHLSPVPVIYLCMV